MKFTPPLFLFYFTSILSFSQEFNVSGKVLDEQGLPISYANVILTTKIDSTIVKGTSTDDTGLFSLNSITEGAYNLKISYIGYRDILKEVSLNQDIDLGTITLHEEAQNLDEVSLVYIKPTLKKEADRLIFNVENSALVEGNILQVLKSTPGVLVMNNGISVKNTQPTVYINNRKVNLSSSDLNQLLESSPANSIKSVEVITNPSAKYDASSGVVLNIVMSKNMVTGYRGSVYADYTQRTFGSYSLGTSQFFKSDKVDIYANYTYSDDKTNRDDIEKINYLNDNLIVEEYWVSNTNRNKWTETHNFNLNFDYSIDTKNTLSLSSNLIFYPNQKYKKSNITDIFDAMKVLDFYYDSNNLEFDNKNNLAFDADYLHKFSKGEISINTHFTDYNFGQDQNVVSNYYDGDDTFLETTAFNTYNNQDTNIYAVKSDYSLPINDSSTFETGLKASRVQTKSSTYQYDIVDGQEVLNDFNTNDFDYNENVFAAYANYSKEWEHWSMVLGLRTEQTNIKSKSALNSQSNEQNYFKWFPTVSISYKPQDNFSLYTNYKRSIERPAYQELNPFRFYYNDNNFFVGNPNLLPEIQDHFVVGTSFFEYFTFESYYINQENKTYVLPLQDNQTKNFIYSPINFDKTVEYGFDFSVSFYATNDWNVYFLTSFYNIESQKEYDNSTVKLDQWSNWSNLQNDFTFLKDRSLNLNLTIFYVGKNLQGFRLVEGRVASNLSISKSILNKKGIISLSAEDLFNNQAYDYSTRFLNQFSTIHLNNDQRLIKIGFRYNFGNTNLKANTEVKNLKERERLD